MSETPTLDASESPGTPDSPEPPSLPALFVGVWTRVSLALDGGDVFENQRVVWAQASSGYADIRTPLASDDDDPVAGPVSFAGTTAWDGASLHWTRTIDLNPGDHDDIGAITWDGDDMIESGEFPFGGKVSPFVEVWRRLPGDVTPRLVLVASDPPSQLVRVGDHCVVVADQRGADGAFSAAYRRLVGDAWCTETAIGDGETLPTPPSWSLTTGEAVELAGMRWQVVESTA